MMGEVSASPVSRTMDTLQVGNATWRDLTDHRFVGTFYLCHPPADCSWEAPTVKRLYGLEPRLRVLWAQRVYQAKEGSTEKRTCLAFAFHHDGPTMGKWKPISNVLLPIHSNGLGISYEQPLVSLSIVDGLELEALEKGIEPHECIKTAAKWREQGRPGRYVPLPAILKEVEQRTWERRNAVCYVYDTGIEQNELRNIVEPLDNAASVRTKQEVRELAGQLRDDRLQIGKEAGVLDHTFISAPKEEAA